MNCCFRKVTEILGDRLRVVVGHLGPDLSPVQLWIFVLHRQSCPGPVPGLTVCLIALVDLGRAAHDQEVEVQTAGGNKRAVVIIVQQPTRLRLSLLY